MSCIDPSKPNPAFKMNPDELFRRNIVIGTKLDISASDLLKFELTQYPMSLFEAPFTLNEPNKPSFADALWKILPPYDVTIPPHCKYVLDGGALLHRTTWKVGSTFGMIIQNYFRYIQGRYCQNSMPVIVFDGYHGPSTKDCTHMRRNGQIEGPQVDFNSDSELTMQRQIFLSCAENKSDFIILLGTYLTKKGCTVFYADGDADCMIVDTAIAISQDNDCVLVGDDTDLLIDKCSNGRSGPIIFKPEPRATQKTIPKLWDIKYTCENLPPNVVRNILILHALHGCDTTSRLPGMRMDQLLRLVN